jgi:nitrate reductase NapE component
MKLGQPDCVVKSNLIMQTYLIDFFLIIGVAIASVAVAAVGIVGLVVWLSGGHSRERK